MHPYAVFHNDEEQLKIRNSGVIRTWGSFLVLFGVALTALELNAYFDDAKEKYTFFSIVGVWSGLTVMTAGGWALSMARSDFTCANHARKIILCHVTFSFLAGVNAMGMFVFHLMNVLGFLDSPAERTETHSIMMETFECASMSLYVVSFLVLSALIGSSIAFFRTLTESDHYSRIIPVDDDITSTPVFVPVLLKHPSTKTTVISDIEATAEGYYKRLVDEEIDSDLPSAEKN